mmetsp:Transcript_31997/g.101981  ORF Transcript_31997/g.101981 Transcript_31997/m.101981 type:complete len:102 (-) Transcript_31997:173-478(-)
MGFTSGGWKVSASGSRTRLITRSCCIRTGTTNFPIVYRATLAVQSYALLLYRDGDRGRCASTRDNRRRGSETRMSSEYKSRKQQAKQLENSNSSAKRSGQV